MEPQTAHTVDPWKPVTIGKLHVKNRFVRSPTDLGAANPKTGEPRKQQVRNYELMAQGEVGTIIVEHTSISERGSFSDIQLRLWNDEHVEYHKRIVDVCHAAPGCKVLLQMSHAGIFASRDGRIGPSDIHEEGMPTTKEATPEELQQVAQEFALAARRAIEAGYDGVEIHAAHSFLISSFLSPSFNHRTDEFGGDADKRMHLLRIVAQAIRKEVGPDFPIWMKINSSDMLPTEDNFGPEDCAYVIDKMSDLIDCAELSSGVNGEKQTACRRGPWHKSPDNEFYHREEFKIIRSRVSVPLIALGGIRSLEGSLRVLDMGADLISLSRPFIRYPDTIARWHRGQVTKSPCISCGACLANYGKYPCVRCHIPYPADDPCPIEIEVE